LDQVAVGVEDSAGIERVGLERPIFFGEASLRTAIQNFVAHHRGERIFRGLGNQLISPGLGHPGNLAEVQRRQRLGGMLNRYYRAAA
jgi:hypothetical protein